MRNCEIEMRHVLGEFLKIQNNSCGGAFFVAAFDADKYVFSYFIILLEFYYFIKLFYWIKITLKFQFELILPNK